MLILSLILKNISCIFFSLTTTFAYIYGLLEIQLFLLIKNLHVSCFSIKMSTYKKSLIPPTLQDP